MHRVITVVLSFLCVAFLSVIILSCSDDTDKPAVDASMETTTVEEASVEASIPVEAAVPVEASIPVEASTLTETSVPLPDIATGE